MCTYRPVFLHKPSLIGYTSELYLNLALYVHETLSDVKYKLQVYGNKGLREVFETKRDVFVGERSILHFVRMLLIK
jgi:hypothetical protein